MNASRHRLSYVLVAVITIAVMFSAYGVKQVFAHRTEYGTCSSITRECHDVPLNTLLLVAGFRWVASSTRVVESSAGFPGAFGGLEYVSGVIELKGTSDPISLGDGTSLPPRNGATSSAADGKAALRRLGVTHITTLRHRGYLVVLSGTTPQHSTLIYVYSILRIT